jgi:fibronectin type 3 domain-containing protein
MTIRSLPLLFILSVMSFGQCAAPVPGKIQGVCLKWTASTTSGVTYSVFRATTTGTENYAAPLASGLTATAYMDSTATTAATYFYTVTAVEGGLLSTPSNEVSVQILTPPNPPSSLSGSQD